MISSMSSGYSDWIWEDLVIPNTVDQSVCPSELCNTIEIVDAEIRYDESSISTTNTEQSDRKEYWTQAKDDMLMKLAVRFEFQWNKLCVFFDGKSTISLRKRWSLVKKAAMSGIRLHDETLSLIHKNSSTSHIYKSLSNISYPKDTLHDFNSRLHDHKESRGISSLIPYRYISSDYSSDSYTPCNEEDSTSTATSEDSSSSGIRSPLSSKNEYTPYSMCHLSTRQKKQILKQLYIKVDDLEVLLNDTNSNLAKITKTINNRKKTNLKI